MCLCGSNPWCANVRGCSVVRALRSPSPFSSFTFPFSSFPRPCTSLPISYVVNQMKEDVCFVSQNYEADAHTCRLKPTENALLVEYMLPDFETHVCVFGHACSVRDPPFRLV